MRTTRIKRTMNLNVQKILEEMLRTIKLQDILKIFSICQLHVELPVLITRFCTMHFIECKCISESRNMAGEYTGEYILYMQ